MRHGQKRMVWKSAAVQTASDRWHSWSRETKYSHLTYSQLNNPPCYDILWALDEVPYESSASHIWTLSEVLNELSDQDILWALDEVPHESSEHDSWRHIWISRTRLQYWLTQKTFLKSTLNWLWMKWATMESLHTNGFTVILQIPVLWHGRMRSEILHWRRYFSLTIRKERMRRTLPWLSTRWISYIREK